jgi:hypothetical protein
MREDRAGRRARKDGLWGGDAESRTPPGARLHGEMVEPVCLHLRRRVAELEGADEVEEGEVGAVGGGAGNDGAGGGGRRLLRLPDNVGERSAHRASRIRLPAPAR